MIHNGCAFGTADLQQSLPHWFGCRFGAGAETAAGATAEAAALAAAKRKRSTGRENRLAKQHVAPMGKRGRWGGINSTPEGRERRCPDILGPCGAAALNGRRSDDPLVSG